MAAAAAAAGGGGGGGGATAAAIKLRAGMEDEVFESLPSMGAPPAGGAPAGEPATSSGGGAGPRDAVITTVINPARAFEVFLGRRYDPAEVLDADCISTEDVIVRPSQQAATVLGIAATLESGQRSRSGRAGGGGGGGGGDDDGEAARRSRALLDALESPLQRYQRLLAETAALEGYLTEVRASDAARGGGTSAANPALGVWQSLVEGMGNLSARLASLSAPVAAAALAATPPAESTAAAGEGGHLAAVTTALAALPSAAAPAAPVKVAAAGAGSGGGGGSATAGVLELDRRLAVVEGAIGTPAGQHHAAAAAPTTTGGSVAARLERLEARLAALTPDGMRATAEDASAALTALQGATRTAAAARSSTTAATTAAATGSLFIARDARLADAVASLEAWDGVAASLPALAARLVTVQGAAHDAAALGATVATLTAAADRIDASLAADRALLTELRDGLSATAATATANFSELLRRAGGAGAGSGAAGARH